MTTYIVCLINNGLLGKTHLVDGSYEDAVAKALALCKEQEQLFDADWLIEQYLTDDGYYISLSGWSVSIGTPD